MMMESRHVLVREWAFPWVKVVVAVQEASNSDACVRESALLVNRLDIENHV